MRNPFNIQSISMLLTVAMAVGLSACTGGEFPNALANCKDELRQQMRDPRGVSIRYLENEETGENSYRLRFRVRGQNGFGANVEQHFVCNWTLTERTETGYTYRVFVSRERR
jgi:hypothetical protein